MARTLTDAQWAQYQRDGYLHLGRVLDDEALAALQQRIDDIMLGTATLDYSRLLMQLDSTTGDYGDAPEQSCGHKGATLAYRKIQELELDPLHLAYLQHPLFAEICAEVYGAHAAVSVYRAMFMNKPAQRGTELPWHQDGGDQWALDRDPLVTIWTALDPATRANGCVEVVPGTHRLGLLSAWGHTITAEQVAEHCPADQVVYLELAPGEVVLLHNWLLHRSGVNSTNISRRAFSACYMDARTRRHNPRTGEIGGVVGSRVFGEGALVAAV